MSRDIQRVEPWIAADPFACVTQAIDGRAVVTVSGEIDLATAPSLQASLRDAMASSATCVVADLGDVGFMDSSGIHVIVDANNAAREQGCSLVVRGAQPNVARVFEVVGLTELLTFEDGA